MTPDGAAEAKGSPFGADAIEPAGRVCKCGAGPHRTDPQRCANGHTWLRNTLTVLAGEGSVAFWTAHETARRELREGIIADAGHTPADAPRTLGVAAETIAQATLIRDSAYLRMA